MHEFTATYSEQLAGVLSGFDRLVFRGTLRQIGYPFGLQGYLWANQILLKDFGAHAQKVSASVKAASLEVIAAAQGPVRYLSSSRVDKEQMARAIAIQDGIGEGPVCALTCVEPCWSYECVATAKPDIWTWYLARANACSCISIGWIRSWVG